jgi:filamentous hemagglutinin
MRGPRQQFPKIAEAMFALGVSSMWSGLIVAGPALPVPCAAGACGVTGPAQFVTSGAATAVATQNALTVNQTTNSTILNWSSFDIGPGGVVTFKQPSASSIALNKIYQASPSQIFGQLNANGQVYLINLNGFVFGKTATVNVGSLLASTLPLALTDGNFKDGILAPLQNDKPVLDATLDPLAPGVGRVSVLDSSGNAVLDASGKPLAVQIVVQPGAQMSAADQGRLLLAGQSVTNGGTLTAPDGQVVVAAGTKVYLQADSDPGLRGLIVEVDGGGTASNQLGGLLSAARGNVTMVGLAVNQEGRVSATTSVSANGSIRLEAANTPAFSGGQGNQTVASSHGGTLNIGSQSEMDILPELASTATAVSAQPQLASSVTLLGEQVILKGGAITAPGGTLTAIAAANPAAAAVNPAAGVSGTADPNARLRIDAGTSIDLSGSDSTLPMSANLVAVQLRSAELADDPTQRDGALHGLTVYVDARQSTPLIANVQGELDAVPQNVAQRTSKGGTAVFQSEGDVVFAKDASLNVSGGSTTYEGGVLQTSYLVGANGQLYPIATANPLLTYVGVVNPTFSQTFDKWGVQEVLPTAGLSAYQPSYVQGSSAGSVQFAAPTILLNGSLRGDAINGLYQRTPATSVRGGQLTIGLPGGTGVSASSPPIDYLAPAIRLSTSSTPIVVSDDASIPGTLTLDLPVAYLTSSGFTSTQLYSNYNVTLPAGMPLVLPAGSTFTVNAASVDVLSSITDPSGTISFQNTFNLGSVSTTSRAGVTLGDGVTLDVRGQWTNDATDTLTTALAQTWQNGGSISVGVSSLNALLEVGDSVTLRASGGAWLSAKGKLTAGTGGSIAFNENAVGGGFDMGNNVAMDAFGVNGASGGTFSLIAPRVEIGAVGGVGGWTTGQIVDDAVAAGNVLQLHTGLFSDYGFQNINIAASGLVAPGAASTTLLSVDSGTAIRATVNSLQLNSGVSLKDSAATLDGLAKVATLAPYQRPAASVTLSALPPIGSTQQAQLGTTTAGDVSIGFGASITTDVGGSIALNSLDSILVNGTLRAPGGTVIMHIISPGVNNGASYGGYEAGFLPNQRIELGAGATVDVSGASVLKPTLANRTLGTVSAGGTIDLFADRGAVVTDVGSVLSVAGASATLDVAQANGTYLREVVATAGGSIDARSGEAISLRGNIEAAAGAGGTTGPMAAGALDVEMTRSNSWWSAPASTDADATFSAFPLTIELLPSVAGLPVSSASSNQAVLGAAQLAQSGLDALRIEAGNEIEFSGALSLALGRQLVIDAPVLTATGGASVKLAAPYLEVGYEPPTGIINSATASGGTGVLSFSGAEIDLVGTTVYQGASDIRFVSSGDLLLRGQTVGTGAATLAGGVTVTGSLTLDAARIYPVTETSFTLNALPNAVQGNPGTVTIGQTGTNPGTPLSAGGALSINADTIVSTGTLYAPFGTISLNAASALTLGDGSLTSVSGTGLTIPFGETLYGGQSWVYGVLAGDQTVSGVPTRNVSLTAPSVTLAKQAIIDLSGGGDLSAFELIPGSGGTKDVLAPGVIPGLYAIVPTAVGQSAPQDPQAAVGAGIATAGTVYLSGGAGVAAGTYSLLPARYGLVPGARLIQIEPQLQSATAGSLGTLADGTPVVAGYLSYGSTGLHQTPGYTGFAIYPSGYTSQLADYSVSLASTYFSAIATAAGTVRPTLPADAGSLAITVTRALDASGLVRTAAATGGLAAPIEISATDLVVGTSTQAIPGAVSIAGAVLNSWQPGSLLLGGTASADGSAIDVMANSVTIGAGSALTADQIVVVANQSIDVQNGASLQSTSAVKGVAPTKLPVARDVTISSAVGGSPALLAVSDLNWLTPTRVGGTGATGAATVAIDAGASIASKGSLTVDALGGVALNGSLSGIGAEWSLGSSSIAFVPTGLQANALSIGPALLAQLGAASAVRLASTGAIDLMTPVTLGVSAGAPTLQSLTLAASSINNLAPGDSGPTLTQFGAHTLTLEGSGVAAVPGVAGETGASLALVSDSLILGLNALSVNGFGTTRATVSGAVTGTGTGGLGVGGDLSIATAGVTADTAAQTSIGATGALAVGPATAGGTGTVPLLLGGALALSGASIEISGTIAAPSGLVTLTTPGNVSLESGSLLSAAGILVGIGNQTVGTAGGTIVINAGGNLTLSSGAGLDVSGAGTTSGGSLAMRTGGTAILGATLMGSGSSASTSTVGGSFLLDAGALGTGVVGANPMTALASSLGTGGFTNAIDLRVRTGDLSLESGSALAANAITLTADGGNVVIGGQVSAASGALRGNVSIFGGAGVELSAGGGIHADGIGLSGLGGKIEIGTGQLVADQTGALNAFNGGTIRLDAGSTISAAGAGGMGTLLLRAPALVGSNDVAIQTLASDTRAVGGITVEAVLPFNTATLSNATQPSSADFQSIQTSVANYMAAAAPAIATRLAVTGGTPLQVEAGVELIAAGDLLLQSADGPGTAALDLQSWRFNGVPIDLTARAAGNIEVANAVTDGFSSVATPTLLAGASSSIRLIAGADLASANPFAVAAASSGSLTIDAGAVVRTGTGDISLIAAKDIVMAGVGSGAYTAGTPAVDAVTIRGGLTMSFPTGGGDLVVRAGEDIINPQTTAAGGVPIWQLRQGGGTAAAPIAPAWGVNLDAYNWNFGTLGGGDLRISAGRDATNISAAAADSLLPQTAGTDPQYVTSGGLSLTAGRDIGSAQVFLADGVGSVTAGRALTAILPSVFVTPEANVGSAFYLQASTLNVNARLGIDVGGVFNPTALNQPRPATGKGLYSYSEDSALNLSTVAGDVVLGAASAASATLLGTAVTAANGVSSLDALKILPASLSIQALSGNISFSNGIGVGGVIALFPSSHGQLNLLAAQDIVMTGEGAIAMSDAVSGSFPTVATPNSLTAVDAVPFGGDIHVGDSMPALVTAGGSIENLALSLPKAARIVAGKDITDLTYFGENLDVNDQTVIIAARDITYSNTYNRSAISVGGPGQLDVLAGRDFSLGFASGGVVTTGNLLNPNLPSAQGSDLTIATGLGSTPDFADFLAKIIAPSHAYQAELVNYVESVQGSSGLSFATAEPIFAGLSAEQQRTLIDQVFFNELLLSGRASNTTPKVGFSQGYAAIDALFPGSRTGTADTVAGAYAGDLTLDYSRIYTLSGGNINLIVPGGKINVGLANPPTVGTVRAPSQLGIVAEGTGNVNIYSQGDVDVNSSRIFTLGGGNILIWSDEGSIDAGRGSKTAISAPPPAVLIDSQGNVTLNFAGAAAGSGIRTIQTNPNSALGSVDLVAPVGTVNAGDAGIGAAGNINIAALSVIGLDNINFGGTSTGVPSQVSNIGASLSGASSAAASTTNSATDSAASRAAADKETAAPLAQTALTWLDVFVTGLGEDNCKPDDVDCLKRQKTAIH